MKWVLAFLLVLVFAGVGVGAVPMPDLSRDYEVDVVLPIRNCPSVTVRAYEAKDGSTRDHREYPFLAWFRGSDPRPFLVVRYNSETAQAQEFWFDRNLDGIADEHGDMRRYKEVFPNDNVCKAVQQVR